MPEHQNFDFIVIGSGFGGSVSALRLAQKGYRVAVLEKGRCYKPSDFPKTNWNLRKSVWMPGLGLLDRINRESADSINRQLSKLFVCHRSPLLALLRF